MRWIKLDKFLINNESNWPEYIKIDKDKQIIFVYLQLSFKCSSA